MLYKCSQIIHSSISAFSKSPMYAAVASDMSSGSRYDPVHRFRSFRRSSSVYAGSGGIGNLRRYRLSFSSSIFRYCRSSTYPVSDCKTPLRFVTIIILRSFLHGLIILDLFNCSAYYLRRLLFVPFRKVNAPTHLHFEFRILFIVGSDVELLMGSPYGFLGNFIQRHPAPPVP